MKEQIQDGTIEHAEMVPETKEEADGYSSVVGEPASTGLGNNFDFDFSSSSLKLQELKQK